MATGEKPPSEHGEIINDTHSESMQSADASLTEAEIRKQTLSQLVELRERFEHMTEIPTLLLDVPLKCLQFSTIQYMSYHLDPESDIQTDNHCLKDYRGLAEQIGLENIFIRFISRANYSMLKTAEVLSKWLTRTEPPAPTLGNLQAFLKAMERYDVLEDMSVKMAKDAVNWKMTEYEARTQNTRSMEDTSWQLTRHDVASGKKTMYTAGLVYADEDELMAQLIIQLYKKAYKNALFFIPNFDLKRGKYVLDTTAKVISERCDHKVVFLLSEYFYASEICQFAVSYAAAHGTGNGNLIPFHLTRNIDAVPNVLKGIAGIRWFRKTTRKHTWPVLTDCLLGEKVSEDLLNDVKDKMSKVVERDEDYYLQDPPYDADIAPPGEPYPVKEPEGMSSMPPMSEMQTMALQRERENNGSQSKSKRWKLLKRVQRVIEEKVLKVHRPVQKSSPSVEMVNINPQSNTTHNGSLGGVADNSANKVIIKRRADETLPLGHGCDQEKQGDSDTRKSTCPSPESDKLLAEDFCTSNKETEDASNIVESDPLMPRKDDVD